jgi:formate dehydrogenase subunit delta
MSTLSKTTPEKLVYMANQIGTFFKSQDVDTASAKIADHIIKYWDPRMRKAILDHLDAGGVGLDPTAYRAIVSLRASAGAA